MQKYMHVIHVSNGLCYKLRTHHWSSGCIGEYLFFSALLDRWVSYGIHAHEQD